MGANVTRIDPKTGKQRNYYKADDGNLYNDYNAAVSAKGSNPIMRFAGDKLKQLTEWGRDNVAVPILDNAMEKGIVPSDSGMYARWATGTQVPLTKRPADINDDVDRHVYSAKSRNLERPNGDIPIHRGSIYPFDEGRIKDSLGSYTVNEKENVIKDRYDFNYYHPSHPDLYQYTGGIKQGVKMLQSGNPRGGIPILHELGISKPGQGYDVRLPLQK